MLYLVAQIWWDEFGINICFSYPKQKNNSMMCFSKSCTTDTLAETIRSADYKNVQLWYARSSWLTLDWKKSSVML